MPTKRTGRRSRRARTCTQARRLPRFEEATESTGKGTIKKVEQNKTTERAPDVATEDLQDLQEASDPEEPMDE